MVEVQQQQEQMMPGDGDEGQLIDELRRLEASARNYQQEVSQLQLTCLVIEHLICNQLDLDRSNMHSWSLT